MTVGSNISVDGLPEQFVLEKTCQQGRFVPYKSGVAAHRPAGRNREFPNSGTLLSRVSSLWWNPA